MNKIQKPEWLLYAGKVRQQLANMSDTKSGKRSELHIWLTYRNACDQKGYRGSLGGWENLLGRRKSRNW
jgi:hypothetical protein